MAVRVARGLFRLWIVFSVIWVCGVGLTAWSMSPPRANPFWEFAVDDPPDWAKPQFNPNLPYEECSKAKPCPTSAETDRYRRAVIDAVLSALPVAFTPPMLLLVFGWALFEVM